MKVDKNLKRLERHLNSNAGRVLNCKFKIKKYLNEIGEYEYEILYNNENYIANLDFMILVFSASLKFLTRQQVSNLCTCYDFLNEVNWGEV